MENILCCRVSAEVENESHVIDIKASFFSEGTIGILKKVNPQSHRSDLGT